MIKVSLKTAQNGTACAPAFCIEQAGQDIRPSTGTDNEIRSFEDAVNTLKDELSKAYDKASDDNRPIMEAEMMMLDDPSFTGAALSMIKDDGLSASEAIVRAGDTLSKQFSENENSYIKSRADDINGLVRELLGIINKTGMQALKCPSILVAGELSPALFSRLDPQLVCGIVTQIGSPVSHLSILAGNLGIPYIYGPFDEIRNIKEGMSLIVDNGDLIIDPDDETKASAEEKIKNYAKEKKAFRQGDIKTQTSVYANAGSIDDIEKAVQKGVSGIGLLRTEFLFLDKNEEPSEEDQFAIYKKAAELMGENEIVIRTMDIGADKKASWLSLADEKNPALGIRGIRVSLNHEEIFRKQIRALLRAAVFGNIKILLPMITSEWEVSEVLRITDECSSELESENIKGRIPDIGVMIETPSSVMIADKLAKTAKFFSIGTNDLTQYTLALDREGEGLDRYYDPCHEAVIKMIEKVCRDAHDNGINVCVCGELAGNESAIKDLIEAGVDKLSVSVSKLERTASLTALVESDLLKEKNAKVPDLHAPCDGRLIPMEDIPDEAFSKGTLGRCIGIYPENNNIYAPCNGKITAIAETKHAISIESENGENLLIHVGIDTVSLNGEGFTLKADTGDEISEGDIIMEADIELIKSRGLSPTVIIAVT